MFAEFHDAYARAFDRDFDQPYTAVELAIDMTPDDYNVSIGLTARDDNGVVVCTTSIAARELLLPAELPPLVIDPAYEIRS